MRRPFIILMWKKGRHYVSHKLPNKKPGDQAFVECECDLEVKKSGWSNVTRSDFGEEHSPVHSDEHDQ